MSVYNKNGVNLEAIYDILGDELQEAYDVDGANVYTAGYSINNVVSYFRTPTLEMADTIDSLNDDWQTIIFVTDQHGFSNRQNSQAVALYLLANTKAKMIVLGGDYSSSQWSEDEYSLCMRPYLNSDYMENIYAVLGNHEVLVEGNRELSVPRIYNDFVEDKEVQGNKAQLYYYVDDTENKTRFMFLNTSEATPLSMSDTQLQWIETNTTLPDTDWSIIVFAHENIIAQSYANYNNFIVGSNQDRPGGKQNERIQNALGNSNGSAIGYFCGHQHIDLVSYVVSNNKKIYESTLLCDRFENNQYFDDPSLYPENNRQALTVTEQVLSVVSFNTKTKDVVIRRLGAGRNQIMSYNYA